MKNGNMIYADLINNDISIDSYTLPWEEPGNIHKMRFGTNIFRIYAQNYNELIQKISDFTMLNYNFSLRNTSIKELKEKLFEENINKRKEAEKKFNEYGEVLAPVWEELYAYLKDIGLAKAPTGKISLAYDISDNIKLKEIMGITDDVKITKLSMAGLRETPIYFINNQKL